MSKELFKTTEDIQAAIANFRALKTVAGWQLVVTMLDNDITALKEIILKGGLPEKELDLKREALAVLERMVNLPDIWIEKLSVEPIKAEGDDPYYTVDSLKEERFKRSQE